MAGNIVLTAAITSQNDTSATVKVTMTYYGNGYSWNYMPSTISQSITFNGVTKSIGPTTFSTSTSAQTMGSAIFTVNKNTGPQSLTAYGRMYTDVSLGTITAYSSAVSISAKSYYTISYNGNGATNGSMSATTKWYNTAVTLAGNSFSKTGYTFMGWANSPSSTSVLYKNKASYTANKSITLYAIWKKNITLSYDGNTGKNVPSSNTKEVYNSTTKATFTISNTLPTKTNHDFLGWQVNTGDAEKDFLQPNGTITLSDNKVLTAQWRESYISPEFSDDIIAYRSNSEGQENTETGQYGYLYFTWKNGSLAGQPYQTPATVLYQKHGDEAWTQIENQATAANTFKAIFDGKLVFDKQYDILISLQDDGREAVTYQTYIPYANFNINDNEPLRKAIDDIYAASVEVNNYQGLATNINQEYDELNLKVNGAPTYDITVTTFKSEIEGILPNTTVMLSDYFEGFECELSDGDELTNTWKSNVNDKDFKEDLFYNYITIKKIPKFYELQYTRNGETVRVPFDSPLTFDITRDGEGATRSFQLVPTEEYENKYIGLKDQIDKLIEEKTQIEKEFYTKYSRFIQEGTWESTDYIDNELYYMDALQVSNASAQPKVSYTINVIEVSELEGLENYEFDVGDRTYIEDTDFFGWEFLEKTVEDEETGEVTVVGANTPVKEIVIVSEVEWHLDEPETNVITVQNYKTQFEDLFQRISATVQSVEYNKASYMRAASILDSNGHINPTLLAGSLNAIAGQSYNLTSNGVLKITDEGIIVRNLTEPGNLLIIKNRGIEKSNNGGLTWENLISPQGVNTELLTSGAIDTQSITIRDGNNPSFRWDANGISAFGYNDDGSYDLSTYVRYDKYGLYGVQNGTDYVAKSLDDIKKQASFGLTWDGFFIKNKYRDGYVSISSTDDFQVVANDTERIRIGHFDDTDGYGIRIRNNSGQVVFETDDYGDLTMAGTIRAAAGKIGGFDILDNSLSSGEFGGPRSVFVSPGFRSSIPIADSTGSREWALAVSNTFGVDTDGHLYATAASIRGNIYAENGYFSGHIDATSGTFMNELQVGSGDKYIVLQGYADRPDSLIASSDYINNPSAGWVVNGTGDAIFNNVSVRGAIRTAVFEYNEIEAVGGAFLFRPSTTIKNARVSGNDLVLKLEKPNLFRVNEWVKLSNVNTESDGVNDILNDGGLTHVYKIKSASGKDVTLEDAAKDFVETSNTSITYDGWGSADYGYREFVITNTETSPVDWGLYELVNNEYVLTTDTEVEIGKTYYEQYYPAYSTVQFAFPYVEADEALYGNLTNYVDLKIGNRYIELNAPRYEVYFDGKGYIKNLNFELRNTSNKTSEIIFNEIESSYIDSVTGERWNYVIEKFIGNLSLFAPELSNTGEHFLVAQIKEKYKATPSSAAVENTYTRIYSDIQGIVPFVLMPYESQATVDSLEGGSLISFGYYNNDSEFEGGIHNYGIGINSSDNYVNLPERAISLFETTIHPEESVKVTYDFKGILGTLPKLGENDVSVLYPSYMEGTQGIFTNNMYIGDKNQYIAFYTDTNDIDPVTNQPRKKLRLVAKEFIVRGDDDDLIDITNSIVEQKIQYTLSSSTDENDELVPWRDTPYEPQEGEYLWQRTYIRYGNGRVNYLPSETGSHQFVEPGPAGPAGPAGEDATVLVIDSSNGNTFKNSNVSTVLTVSVFKGTTIINNLAQLQENFGNTAYLQWYWKRQGESTFREILSTDSMLSNGGFTLTLTPDKVDIKVVFQCEVKTVDN